jgi:death on curing protein
MVLDVFGGPPGVLNLGLIESAIARPYCGYYRKIYQKAASLTHGVACNHGFVDGNKRTSIYAVGLLLGRSGYEMPFSGMRALNKAMENIVLDVADHRMS